MSSNIKCIHIHKTGCEFYINRMDCPENCEGFVSKEGKEKVDTVVANIEFKRSK